jgi:hypothetical protein
MACSAWFFSRPLSAQPSAPRPSPPPGAPPLLTAKLVVFRRVQSSPLSSVSTQPAVSANRNRAGPIKLRMTATLRCKCWSICWWEWSAM